MPSAAATGATAPRRSPDRIMQLEPERAQRRDGLGGVGAQRLADGEDGARGRRG